jgi:hypothetical protein
MEFGKHAGVDFVRLNLGPGDSPHLGRTNGVSGRTITLVIPVASKTTSSLRLSDLPVPLAGLLHPAGDAASGFAASRSMAVRSAPASPTGMTSAPPSATISRTAPTGVTTEAMPTAIASTSELGNPSPCEGKRNTSALRINSSTRLCSAGLSTAWMLLRCRASTRCTRDCSQAQSRSRNYSCRDGMRASATLSSMPLQHVLD